MSNNNQYNFSKLPHSKIIITDDLYQRLLFLMGRSAWVASEHMCIFYGKEIESNVILFDEMNQYEDYNSRGEGSKNPYDHSVGPGDGKFAEELETRIKSSSKWTIIADIHTHPSNVCFGNGDEEEYRYFSTGDIKTSLRWNDYLEKYGLEHVAGLIGVDRINGNMTISFIWYSKKDSKVYLFDDVVVYHKELEKYESLPKVGDIQLLYKNWGLEDVPLSKQVEEQLKSLK